MSKIVQLKAASRARAGKGASRAVRRDGLIPAVVYGDKQEPNLISLTYGDVLPHIETGRFLSTLIDLEVDGKTVRAIPRDVQFEPVRDFIVHIDFLRLGKDARIKVNVPVHFKGQDVSPGIKQGGTLNIVSHSVALTCSANLIPDDITIDVSAMQVGQSVHLSNVTLPEGVKSASTDDVTLCAITAQAKEEEAPADAPAEVPAANQKAPAGKAAAPAKGAAPAAAAPAKKK